MAGEGILIVDDNPQNVKLIRAVLAGEGYDVQSAGDAEEALRVLSTFQPSLILMDIQLPGMDGLELTRRLKADPVRGHIRIIALTAYAMKGDDTRALAAGCDAYITKPIDVEDFPRLIRSHVRPT